MRSKVSQKLRTKQDAIRSDIAPHIRQRSGAGRPRAIERFDTFPTVGEILADRVNMGGVGELHGQASMNDVVHPTRGRTHPGRFFLAGFVTAAIIGGGIALAWEQTRPGPTYETVPVVACPSTYGIPGGQPPDYPSRMAMKVPNSIGSAFLDFYSDGYRILTPVLGPAGWNCSTNLGADGTFEIAVYPEGHRDPLNSSGRARGDVQAVISDGSSVCGGCSGDIACPVFTEALSSFPGTSCPLTSPSRELVSYLSGNYLSTHGTAQVYDPAGVDGSLPQSGGSNPAKGIIAYSASKVTSAGVLSCVLPPSDSNLCSVVIDNYLSPTSPVR